MSPNNTKPDNALVLLTPRDAAQYLGLSVSTLARLRRHSVPEDGPRYCKLGGSIRYCLSDLDAWVQQNTQTQASAFEQRAAKHTHDDIER